MTSTIVYTDSLDRITSNQLHGFFVGWPNPPVPATHLRFLQSSYRVWLALDTQTGQVVGFVNAISDGVLSAYIPLLEVHPDYHGRGIGTELMQRMFASLDHLYMIDLACDKELIPFYERLGMSSGTAMVRRNYARQSGAE